MSHPVLSYDESLEKFLKCSSEEFTKVHESKI